MSLIKELNNLEELIEEINKDKNNIGFSSLRYPVRFIFLNNFIELSNIKKYFDKNKIKLFELKKIFPHNDGWVTPSILINSIEGFNDDVLIVPLTEILRFMPQEKFRTVIMSLTEIENSQINSMRRIYIPLVGIFERFQNEFLNYFARKENWAPIWKLKMEGSLINEKAIIYLFKFVTDFGKEFRLLNNSIDMMDLWKNFDDKKIISKSRTLNYLCDNFLPDQFFNKKVIDNYKELIEEFFNLKIMINYKEKDKKYWKRIICKITDENNLISFRDFMENHFNIKNISEIKEEEFINLLIKSNDDYEIWLLKNWIITNKSFKDNYIYDVLNDLEKYTFKDFIREVWFKLFYLKNFSTKKATERKKYLNYLHKYLQKSYEYIEKDLNEELEEKFKTDDISFFNYLTDITEIEKKFIILAIKNYYAKDRDKLQKIVKDIYPKLFYYLQGLEINSDINWIEEYFYEYKLSKLLNEKSTRLNDLINIINENKQNFYKWYYLIKDNRGVEKIINKDELIVWIDALGIEWFGLLVNLLIDYGKDNNIFVEEKIISRSNLPTITECNAFNNNIIKINSLDKFIHKQEPYIYPDDLVKEIDLLNEIVKEEIFGRSWENLKIISDHGFTVFAQKKFGNYKKYNFKSANHEGRYMWTKEDYQDDQDFFLHKIDSGEFMNKKVLITLKHSVLFNIPFREVHGGATPEEVLIPVIYLTKIKKEVDYRVSIKNPIITLREPSLIINIDPDPKVKPFILLEDKEYNLIEINNKWVGKLEGVKPGKYKIELKILNKKYDFEIEMKGGFKDKDLI